MVTRCGPTMNRLLRLRERHVDLMNVRDHSSLVSNSCPCNAQYAWTFKSLKMCSFISTNRFDLMSVGTGVSTYGGPIVNNPLNISSLLKEVASHQTCYQNSLWWTCFVDSQKVWSEVNWEMWFIECSPTWLINEDDSNEEAFSISMTVKVRMQYSILSREPSAPVVRKPAQTSPSPPTLLQWNTKAISPTQPCRPDLKQVRLFFVISETTLSWVDRNRTGGQGR